MVEITQPGLDQGEADLIYWKKDGSNGPATGNWDLGVYTLTTRELDLTGGFGAGIVKLSTDGTGLFNLKSTGLTNNLGLVFDLESSPNIITITKAGLGSLDLHFGNGPQLINLVANNYTGNSFIKTGGTSSQFLKADGSVDTLLSDANVWTNTNKINVNSASAFVVEQTGVRNNVIVVDTQYGGVGVNVSPTIGSYALNVVGLAYSTGGQNISIVTGQGLDISSPGFNIGANGGNLTIATSRGSNTSSGTVNVGGNSGTLILQTANGGNGATQAGTAGDVQIRAGVAGTGPNGMNGNLYFYSGSTQIAGFVNNISRIGNFGIGVSLPNAKLQLPAGTATAYTAPLMFTSGINLAVPSAGAVEFTTDNLYFTITTGAARKNITLDEGLTSGDIPIATTNGRLMKGATPLAGTVTITTAQLTALGSQGSMTFVNGILTAQVQAT